MSHHDQAAARIHSLRWFLKNTARIARFDRMKGRRRGGERITLSIDHLESRTLLTVSALIGPVPSSPPGPVPASETLNLQLMPGATMLSSQLTPLIEAAGASVQTTTVPGLFVLQGTSSSLDKLFALLATNPQVQYAQPSTTVSAQVEPPNDPYYTEGYEWQLNGTWGINAQGAWNATTGLDTNVVADTDTGIAYNVPNIYDNVWINQAEIPSTVLPNLTDVEDDGVITFSDLNAVVNGVAVNQGPGKIEDTNGDGIITATDLLAPTTSGGWVSSSTQDGDTAHPDDLIGWNFVSNNNTPIDQNGHGTFTAGEIGAVTNTVPVSPGSSGTARSCRFSSCSTGSGSDAAAAEAIDYAVNHGAKIINASWGGTGTDPTIAAAIQYADQNNVIIVAAAGNDSADDDTTFFAPASYSSQYPNLISVAAITDTGASHLFPTTAPARFNSRAGYGVGGVGIKRQLRLRQRHFDGRPSGCRHARAGRGCPSELVDEPGHLCCPRPHDPRPRTHGQGDHRRHLKRRRGRHQHRRALRRLRLSRRVCQYFRGLRAPCN